MVPLTKVHRWFCLARLINSSAGTVSWFRGIMLSPRFLIKMSMIARKYLVGRYLLGTCHDQAEASLNGRNQMCSVHRRCLINNAMPVKSRIMKRRVAVPCLRFLQARAILHIYLLLL